LGGVPDGGDYWFFYFSIEKSRGVGLELGEIRDDVLAMFTNAGGSWCSWITSARALRRPTLASRNNGARSRAAMLARRRDGARFHRAPGEGTPARFSS